MMPDQSLFSLVVPVFNEEENLEELTRRIGELFDELDFEDHEAVLVNDGSFDRTEEILRDVPAEHLGLED